MKLTILNSGDHILDENKDNKSEIALSDVDSENEEAFNEKDVSIQRVITEGMKDFVTRIRYYECKNQSKTLALQHLLFNEVFS